MSESYTMLAIFQDHGRCEKKYVVMTCTLEKNRISQDDFILQSDNLDDLKLQLREKFPDFRQASNAVVSLALGNRCLGLYLDTTEVGIA